MFVAAKIEPIGIVIDPNDKQVMINYNGPEIDGHFGYDIVRHYFWADAIHHDSNEFTPCNWSHWIVPGTHYDL